MNIYESGFHVTVWDVLPYLHGRHASHCMCVDLRVATTPTNGPSRNVNTSTLTRRSGIGAKSRLGENNSGKENLKNTCPFPIRVGCSIENCGLRLFRIHFVSSSAHSFSLRFYVYFATCLKIIFSLVLPGLFLHLIEIMLAACVDFTCSTICLLKP